MTISEELGGRGAGRTSEGERVAGGALQFVAVVPLHSGSRRREAEYDWCLNEKRVASMADIAAVAGVIVGVIAGVGGDLGGEQRT